MKKLIWIICVIILAAAVFTGCTKKEEPAPPAAEQQAGEDMQKTAEETAAAAAEQKVCPVMGNPIDKSIYVEYQGKKVYFCCSACVEKFKENPEQYISKLPQFKK